jgi:adenosylcobinamide kinase/adenosylcobinamide-phosphate guanylyltransferase
MKKNTFILGGVRSGKSLYAEKIALGSRRPKLYLATAKALDTEMEERIRSHRARRGPEWQALESPVDIAGEIVKPVYAGYVILVDCLTLWLANIIDGRRDVIREFNILTNALKNSEAEIILVSNEVGQGIIPDNELARKFCDYAGILHQQVADVADVVIFMVAGQPMRIKG